MAVVITRPPLLMTLLLHLLLLGSSFFLVVVSGVVSSSSYSAMFSFGDSLTDTGNIAVITNASGFTVPPYGDTFFGRPTGRASNGRLVVDFLAEAFGLPLPPPYLAGGDHRRGANYAVLGATALGMEFFRERGAEVGPSHLGVQIGWAVSVLNANPDIASSSFFMLGEVGGNDYNWLLDVGLSMEDLYGIIPTVVDAICSAVTALVEAGARTVMVPGNLPMGCSPFYMKLFPLKYTNLTVEYDAATGCIETLNALSRAHNDRLQHDLAALRISHPLATIIYFDLYASVDAMLRRPLRHGFTAPPTTACCGGGGEFNFNFSSACGQPGSAACGDPEAHVYWDGAHLTEAAYAVVAADITAGRLSVPSVPLATAAIAAASGSGSAAH